MRDLPWKEKELKRKCSPSVRRLLIEVGYAMERRKTQEEMFYFGQEKKISVKKRMVAPLRGKFGEET